MTSLTHVSSVVGYMARTSRRLTFDLECAGGDGLSHQVDGTTGVDAGVVSAEAHNVQRHQAKVERRPQTGA